MKRKVLILFGGKSYEHDISIVSAFQCVKAFDEYLYDISLVYIDLSGKWRLVKKYSLEHFLSVREKLQEVQLCVNDNYLYIKGKSGKYKQLSAIDVVFPIMHGLNGEDGCIAGYLSLSNIPYVGSDNVSSAIGIDKSLFKKVCNNLPVVDYVEFSNFEPDRFDNKVEFVDKKVGFPCIIKPVKLGSSIGINYCENKDNFEKLLKKSLNFDKKVIIEPFIKNMREFNIALFSYCGDVVYSEIEEPLLNDNILTFNDKYMNFSEQSTHKNIPAKLNQKLRNEILNMAKQCYVACGCSGVVRVDFIYDKDSKKLYINEVNTIPGALGLYLFEASGIDRKEVVNMLIHEAIRGYNIEKKNQIYFDSSVLKNKNLSKFNKF